MDELVHNGQGTLLVGMTTNKTPMAAMHFHTGYEIYYLIKGERTYYIKDRKYPVNEGEIITVPKGVLHKTGGKGGTRLLIIFEEEYLSRYFKPEFIHALLKNFDTAVLCPLPGKKALVDGKLKLVYNLHRAVLDGDTTVEYRLAMAVFDVIYTLCEAKNYFTKKDSYSERLSDIMRYINENYGHLDNGIAGIAERFFISKYYLCHLFKSSLGLSVIDYVNMVKIREACRLLEDENESVLSVATKCGFNSGSYFAKVFKSYMGIGANEYRKKHENPQF